MVSFFFLLYLFEQISHKSFCTNCTRYCFLEKKDKVYKSIIVIFSSGLLLSFFSYHSFFHEENKIKRAASWRLVQKYSRPFFPFPLSKELCYSMSVGLEPRRRLRIYIYTLDKKKKKDKTK